MKITILRFILGILLPIFVSGHPTAAATEKHTIVLEISPSSWQELLKPIKVEIIDDDMYVQINGQRIKVLSVASRGQTSIRDKRRNLTLRLSKSINYQGRRTKKILLSSMASDDHYLSNRIAYGLMSDLGVYHLPNDYADFRVSDRAHTIGQTQGLYLVTPSPKEVVRKDLDAIWSARILGKLFERDPESGRFNWVGRPVIEVEDQNNKCSNCSDRVARLFELYKDNSTSALKGPELFAELQTIFDMDQMFRWLALNRLLRNGDFADEFFFYTDDQSKPFRLLGWDNDDLRKDKMHVFSRWSLAANRVMTLLGARRIATDSLIYNYGFVLFKIVAKDPFVLGKYHDAFARLILDLEDQNTIAQTLARVKSEITPYFDDPQILARSIDDNPNKETGIAYTPESTNHTIEEWRAHFSTEIEEIKQLPAISDRLKTLRGSCLEALR